MARSTHKPLENGDVALAPSRPSGVKKKNLSLTDASLNTIEELKAATDAATAAEIVRRALAFYAMAIRKQQEGGRILYRDRDGTTNGFVFL